MRVGIAIGTFVLAAMLCGCTSSEDMAVPAPSQVGSDPKGRDVEFRLHKDRVSGELIGVKDGHYLLLQEGITLVGLDTNGVIHARVIISRTSENPRRYAWSSALPLLSISHGAFGVISLPINLIAAISVNAGSAWSRNVVELEEPVRTGDLLPYARFPQGVPPRYLDRHPVRYGER
jgi:hypothetical protein